MEREGEAVMVAVLESLVEEEPFHSSKMISVEDEFDASMKELGQSPTVSS